MSALNRLSVSGVGQTDTRLTRRNPPGLAELSYRGGVYAGTLQRMLARLAQLEQLARLNPDAMDDWAIALLHAAAVVTDVLSFYQERITNDGYLNTAVDRRSVLELARAIGYELRPGVAATAHLALLVSPDGKNQPFDVPVPKGSVIQSIPGEGQLPQIFETSTDAVVRSDWNVLRPVATNQSSAAESDLEPILIDETALRVAGYRTDLRQGDLILLTGAPSDDQPPASILGALQTVVADPQKPYTLITWESISSDGEQIERPRLFVFRRKAKLYGYPAGAVYFNLEPPAATTGGAGTEDATADGPDVPTSSNPPTPLADAASPVTPQPSPDPTQPGDEAHSADIDFGHWTPSTLGLPNTVINALTVNAAGVLFAGTQFDVFRSKDEGATWQPAGVDRVQRTIMALSVAPDGALFAGSNTGGIYVSRDEAENWTPVSGDLIAPDSSIEDKGAKKKVVYDQILPKAPVRELEVLLEEGKTVVYAGTDKGIFRSYDEGKTWEGPLKTTGDGKLAAEKTTESEAPPAEPPPAQGDVQPQAAAAPLPPLVSSVTLAQRLKRILQTVGPAAKALGIDILALVTPWFGPGPQETPIHALAVDPSGRKPTLFVGTDAGKFRLQGGSRRWLLVGVILALVMLTQFVTNRGLTGALSLKMTGGGAFTIEAGVLAPDPISANGDLTFQGTLTMDPRLPMTDALSLPLVFVGEGNVTIQPGPQSGLWVASGGIRGAGNLLAIQESITKSLSTADISGLAVLTLTAASGVTVSTEITQPVAAHVVFTSTGDLTTETRGAVSLASALVEIRTGDVTAPAAGVIVFPWLNEVWQWVQELFQDTVVAAIDAVQTFLKSLWEMLPEALRGLLTLLYELVWGRILNPVFDFINAYLIQPMLNYTAATLAQASLIALAVWLLRRLWQRLQQKWLNRAGVRIDAPVNALLIRDNGQIFAGTPKGIYRSLENDPQTLLPTRLARMALRTLFKDRVMKPINTGLLDLEGKPPDIRTLALAPAGALLAGADDGRIFRSTDNGDHWVEYGAGLHLASVRMLVPTQSGVFAAGSPADSPVEDAWFSAQLDRRQIDLAALYDDVKPGAWVVLSMDAAPPDGDALAGLSLPARRRVVRYRIDTVEQIVPRSFGAVASVTRLTASAAPRDELAAFARAKTELFLQSEPIALFDNRPVAGDALLLQGYMPELRNGHTFILSGETLRARVASSVAQPLRSLDGLNSRLLAAGDVLKLVQAPVMVSPPIASPAGAAAGAFDAGLWRWHLRTHDGFEGVVDASRRQIRLIAPVESDPVQSELIVARSTDALDENTELRLASPLARVYDRATVSLAGNIVEATHGSSVTGEILGSGSGMQANERFVLPEKPLTYLSAATDSGVQTTLAININGIRWRQVRSLYEKAPGDRVFVVRHTSDERTTVIFGDGRQGARLPTGTEHVTASYRIGSGLDGNVAADALTQVQDFPSAVQKAANPLDASGGTAAEATDHARVMAPLSVRGLGRIVSLSDYEDFARTFGGIGRVRIAAFGEGRRRVIHLTVADAAGRPIGANSDVIEPGGVIDNLRRAIDAVRASPTPPVIVQSYERLYFDVRARLVILPDHIGRVAQIEQDAHRALLDAFSFARRAFGQAVAESEVVAVLSGVTGVYAVKETVLHLHGQEAASGHARPERLTALLARREGEQWRPAQMLLLNPTSLVLNPALKVFSRDELGIDLEIVAQTSSTQILNDPKAPS
jgi:predicted phage baseplate assembly protein